MSLTIEQNGSSSIGALIMPGDSIEWLLLALLGALASSRRDSARSLSRVSDESERCATIAHAVAVIKQPTR